MMDAMPLHRLAPSAMQMERESSVEDCLDEAQEALALAQQQRSKGDRERLRLWIRDAQDWLDQAERITR